MELSEAEIQVLASLERARLNGTPSDRKTLEAGGDRFWVFKDDWSDAFTSLMEKQLIAEMPDGYQLTADSQPIAEAYHRERPDHYWYYYQKFYQAAWASHAHSQLCERVFGKDLCQEGQADMDAFLNLLEMLQLREGDDVLDLGCGAGVLAEYVSDTTGATVTGLDYAAPAIAEATARTAEKRSRLRFIEGDMNALDLPDASFDAVISLDTLYWVADLETTIGQLRRALKPGGQMGIFMNHHIEDRDPSSDLGPEHADLFKALESLGIALEAHDYTTNICRFWRRMYEAATDLRDEFEAEGNGLIAASLIREAEEEFLPDVEAGRIARYLFHVRL